LPTLGATSEQNHIQTPEQAYWHGSSSCLHVCI